MFTLYTDNPTVVDGGNVRRIEDARSSQWYQTLQQAKGGRALYFQYDDSESPAVAPKRKVLFLQKLNFYQGSPNEKVMAISMDYGTII